MSIYTKTGDKGTTSLIGGQRLKKYHPRVEAYGTVDELNACLSVAVHLVRDDHNRQLLLDIQHQLFWIGAELADDQPAKRDNRVQRISEEHIVHLEQAIDRCMAALPPVTGFVLPGDTPAGSQLHLARTVARRAERLVVQLADEVTVRAELLRYLNRLSDCLYALARSEDQRAKNDAVIKEVMRRYQAGVGGEATANDHREASLNPAIFPIPNTTGTAGDDKQSRTENPVRQASADGLDFALIHGLMRAAVEAAREMMVPVVMSIVDCHGNPVMTYRMPDSLLIALELAPKKAFTAVALKTATHNLGPSVQPGADLFQLETSSGGKIVTFGGGYPLYRSGRLIGGLGISGGTAEQDRQIAQRAVMQCHVESK